MARTTKRQQAEVARKATEAAQNDAEASADVLEAARAIDDTKPKTKRTRKATAKEKQTAKAPRDRKYTEEIVQRALELRANEGLGFHRVAGAVQEEFKLDNVSPHALRAAMLKAKGVESSSDIEKGALLKDAQSKH